MTKRLAAAALVVALATVGLTSASSTRTERTAPIGLARILNAYQPSAIVTGIATFDTVPNAARVDGLRALGLVVQPMKHLPLASVQGPVAAMKAAVDGALANDVYPNEKYEYFDKESTDSMGTAALRAKGLTGKGVTVAVVDSGCDATHPDLADHITHNVKLLSGEYINLPPDSSHTLPIVMSDTPYSNTDPTSGHGTYVAGIIAADGTSDPSHLGVAPDAEIVCLGIGEGIFTTAVVTAYDYLLDQPDLWGVDVINNSWGNSFYMFDPRHPVHVATKAMADQGVVIVFAAGNSGDSNAEMSTSTFSTAPWVLGIAAADVKRRRTLFVDGEEEGAFSSNGLIFDNARPLSIGKNGYRGFKRNRLGMYHPDLTAPGVLISSSCASTGGAAVGPCGPAYGNETASGTSAASPHVAGAAAILLQANPQLSWLQVQQALQTTARPDVYNEDVAGKRTRLGYWQVGYGFVDLNAAVQLVTANNWATALAARQRAADRRLLRSIGYTVARSDMWQYDAPRVALAGITDTRTFRKQVAPTVTHLKVTLAHPSLYAVGMNEMLYSVTVRDAAGNVLGTTEEAAAGSGTSSLFLDLKKIENLAYGAFTFEVIGDLAVSDPDNLDSESLLGRVVVLQVAQLVPLR